MTTMPSPRSTRSPRTAWIVLAFAYVYFAWGATYMGVHYALQTMPPFLMAGCRFVLAGVVLLALLRAFSPGDFHLGSVREWRDAAAVGCLLLVGGNGALAWSQQYVNTSHAALIFGSMPLFIILADWLRPGGVAPSLRTGLGLALGFVGLCILIQPSGAAHDSRTEIWGKLGLLFAAVSWSAGAIYSRHVHAQGSPLLPMGRQMLLGGCGLLLVSVAHGDWTGFSIARVTMASWLGWAYLVIFGSLFGFTAYVWLMRVSTPARVATISYINIVVAVAIGCTYGGEPLTSRLAVGAGIIVGSVVLVISRPRAREAVEAAPEM